MAPSDGPWSPREDFVEVHLMVKREHEDLLAKSFDFHWKNWLPSLDSDVLYHVVVYIFGGNDFGK